MICPNCKREVPDTAKACGHCGHWLAGDQVPTVQVPEDEEATVIIDEARGSPPWLWIGVGVVIIVLVVVAFLVGRGSGGGGVDAEATIAAALAATQQAEAVAAQPTEAATPAPPPTATPVPPTEAPTPTATVDADSTVYDDFNNTANDGSFNRSRWRYWTDPPNQIAQQDGILIVTQDGKPDKGTHLAARKYAGVTLSALTSNTPIFFEARLMLDHDEHAGAVQLHLSADLPVGEGWYSECGIGYDSDAQAGANCSESAWPWQEGHDYSSEWKPVDYGTWHTFRIEVDPATMTVTYYMDDQTIDSHIPVDAEALKKARFTLAVGVWGPSSEALTGYIDDVRVGQIGQ